MTDKINNSETKKTRLRLSERLKLVASFVPEGSRIADIGTDHGYVPIYLAETGKIKSALAMDVRKGPLARADEHIEEYRRDAGDAAISIETRLSNGLEKLHVGEADTVIIAGMGGELEISILENGKQLWGSHRGPDGNAGRAAAGQCSGGHRDRRRQHVAERNDFSGLHSALPV